MTVRQNEAVRREDETRAAGPGFLRHSRSVSPSAPDRLLDFYIDNRRADLLRRSDHCARIGVHKIFAFPIGPNDLLWLVCSQTQTVRRRVIQFPASCLLNSFNFKAGSCLRPQRFLSLAGMTSRNWQEREQSSQSLPVVQIVSSAPALQYSSSSPRERPGACPPARGSAS